MLQTELVGKNCRMLQGSGTEEVVVAEMVRGLRDASDVGVLVTNYRKDKKRFRNGLYLHPVVDTNKQYRWVIAFAIDADEATEKQLAIQVRDMLDRCRPPPVSVPCECER